MAVHGDGGAAGVGDRWAGAPPGPSGGHCGQAGAAGASGGGGEV